MHHPITHLIIVIMGLGSVIGSIILMIEAKNKIPPGQVSQQSLIGNEKVKAWILAFCNPIWTGVILYFGWRKKLPTKAKKVKIIFFISLGIWIILDFLEMISESVILY